MPRISSAGSKVASGDLHPSAGWGHEILDERQPDQCFHTEGDNRRWDGAYTTGGWQTQLDRVRRWYNRASKATDPTERWDYLYAFFENAFRLRDWLKDTGAIPEADLKKFFGANEEMRLCQDLANSHKHYSLRWPSLSTPPSEFREYSPATGNLSSDISLMILSDGKKYDPFDLAKRILQLWEAFVPSTIK